MATPKGMASRTASADVVRARAAYDAMSGWYAMAARFESPLHERALAALRPEPGERVLEVGAGTGELLVAIARAVGPRGRAVGLDVSSGMLAAARRTVRQAGADPSVSLVVGDGGRLPFEDGRLDAVVMAFTLERFPEDRLTDVLAEARRALRVGGRLVVVSMGLGEPGAATVDLYEALHRRWPRWFDCRPIDAAARIEAAGFAVSASETTTMWTLPVDVVAAVRA